MKTTLVIQPFARIDPKGIKVLYRQNSQSRVSVELLPNPGTKLIKRTEPVQGVGREEFDKVVKTSILDSVRMIGDDYLDLFLSFIQRRNGIRTLDLQDADAALDSIFLRFSILVKHVIMFQICAALKLEPQKLLKSLEWTIQELRSSCW